MECVLIVHRRDAPFDKILTASFSKWRQVTGKLRRSECRHGPALGCHGHRCWEDDRSRKENKIMFRTLFAAAVLYAYWQPSFDGRRPASFDKPMQGFYTDVNVAASDSRRALAVLDDTRCMHYLDVLMARLGTELHSP
jgi:hypothetical protein